MSVTMLTTDYAIGMLKPKGTDAQGNKVDASLKANSLVAYTSSDSSLVTITPNPTNPLQFKVAGVPGSAGGAVTITAKGINTNGDEVTFTDTITTAPTPPPPPPVVATSFDVEYTTPADQTTTPAPF